MRNKLDCESNDKMKFLKFYPQVFSKELKYSEKEKRMIRYITNNLKLSSDYSD